MCRNAKLARDKKAGAEIAKTPFETGEIQRITLDKFSTLSYTV
jgi:hypothetical protein